MLYDHITPAVSNYDLNKKKYFWLAWILFGVALLGNFVYLFYQYTKSIHRYADMFTYNYEGEKIIYSVFATLFIFFLAAAAGVIASDGKVDFEQRAKLYLRVFWNEQCLLLPAKVIRAIKTNNTELLFAGNGLSLFLDATYRITMVPIHEKYSVPALAKVYRRDELLTDTLEELVRSGYKKEASVLLMNNSFLLSKKDIKKIKADLALMPMAA